MTDAVGEQTPEAVAAEKAAAKKLFGTKIAYGIGSIAFGVKDNGFGFFLLLFYSQVIGVDARLVGLALTIALIFDAISDPIVGYWSDNLRSPWGRRHPFMYASAIPIGLTYYLLWNPPVGWTDGQLFWYLLVLAIAIRTFVTFYETPSSALAPELTGDYDQRSSFLSYRAFFGWTGGNAMTVVTFALIFPAFVTATIPNGQFNRDSYELYGIIGGALMVAAILISSIGTHSRIPYLKSPPPKRHLTLRAIFGEMAETLANRSFGALFIAALFGAIAAGLSAALSFYFLTYFWGFTSGQSSLITIGVFGSAIIGALMAPIVTRTMGKKKGAIIIGLVAFLGAPFPVVLRLFGLLNDGSDPFTFWFVFITTLIDVGLIICFQILTGSMMSDLVEQSEVKTGRRSEGLFISASTFIRKVVAGIGVITATMILTLAGIQAGADPSQVSDRSIWLLGAWYVPIILSLWLSMVAVIAFYNIDRAGHEANLQTLADRKEAAGR